MKQFGTFLIIAGIIGILFFQLGFDTSVKVDYEKTGYSKPSGFPERVNNLGLMQDKQNYTLISFGIIIVGVILFVTGKKNEEKVIKEDTERQPIVKSNAYKCSKCGLVSELEPAEIEKKKFTCLYCATENIIT
jgi:hypothetical protein